MALAKIGLAKTTIAKNGMAKTGLAKIGLFQRGGRRRGGEGGEEGVKGVSGRGGRLKGREGEGRGGRKGDKKTRSSDFGQKNDENINFFFGVKKSSRHSRQCAPPRVVTKGGCLPASAAPCLIVLKETQVRLQRTPHKLSPTCGSIVVTTRHLMDGGSSRARANANCLKMSEASSLHLPPVSKATTKPSRHRLDATSSG